MSSGPDALLSPAAGVRVEINRPDVVAEVTEAFVAYEQALVDGDVAAMTDAFWESEFTVRYGIDEVLYGADEIAAWRGSAPPIPPGRRLGPTVVATFGTDFACVSTEFRNAGNTGRFGRQSQTWVRMPAGWQVVAAHVSLQDEA
ncbi:MAG: hypothetical protein QOF57_2374 [Frankiaceae bacterium]|jgi:hypothetical protein|nr:hypothetical protein [Frankiaceae bacterium]